MEAQSVLDTFLRRFLPANATDRQKRFQKKDLPIKQAVLRAYENSVLVLNVDGPLEVAPLCQEVSVDQNINLVRWAILGVLIAGSRPSHRPAGFSSNRTKCDCCYALSYIGDIEDCRRGISHASKTLPCKKSTVGQRFCDRCEQRHVPCTWSADEEVFTRVGPLLNMLPITVKEHDMELVNMTSTSSRLMIVNEHNMEPDQQELNT